MDRYAKRWFCGVDSTEASAKPDVAEKPAWIVNGKDKMAKLKRLLGTHAENAHAIVRNQKGEPVAEIRDLLQHRTDLNKLFGPGEFRLEFQDKDGKAIPLMQEVGEMVRLK